MKIMEWGSRLRNKIKCFEKVKKDKQNWNLVAKKKLLIKKCWQKILTKSKVTYENKVKRNIYSRKSIELILYIEKEDGRIVKKKKSRYKGIRINYRAVFVQQSWESGTIATEKFKAEYLIYRKVFLSGTFRKCYK